jgi:hypothetical protein
VAEGEEFPVIMMVSSQVRLRDFQEEVFYMFTLLLLSLPKT